MSLSQGVITPSTSESSFANEELGKEEVLEQKNDPPGKEEKGKVSGDLRSRGLHLLEKLQWL